MLCKILKVLWSLLMATITLASIYGILVAGNGVGAIPGYWIMDQAGDNAPLRALGSIVAAVGVIATFVITLGAAIFFGMLTTKPWEPRPLRAKVNGNHSV